MDVSGLGARCKSVDDEEREQNEVRDQETSPRLAKNLHRNELEAVSNAVASPAL